MTLMSLTASYLNLSGPGDVSSKASQIQLQTDVDENDVTTFGSLGWKEVLGGLKSGSLQVSFFNDFTDDELDEDLFAVNGSVINFIAKASSAATSASNPEYRGSVLIKGLSPLNAQVGQVSTMSVTWPTSGAITRTTTSA